MGRPGIKVVTFQQLIVSFQSRSVLFVHVTESQPYLLRVMGRSTFFLKLEIRVAVCFLTVVMDNANIISLFKELLLL